MFYICCYKYVLFLFNNIKFKIMITIKTEKEVGELIQKSKIDNRDVRMICASELENLEIGDFELIYSHECNENSMKLAQVIILNKLMKQK